MFKFKSPQIEYIMVKKVLSLFLFNVLLVGTTFSQRSYKALMQDNSVNFYEVCAVADAYFETIDKTKKGSGWKGYQRWKNENESKFYPSGDRSKTDPYLVKKAYAKFLEKYPRTTEKTVFDAGWEEVGPVTINNVTGHYSPGLGRIETFYVNPLEGNTMYIGSRSGGFWKSLDGGDSWVGGSTDFLFASGVNTIAVSPTNPDSILINVRNAGNGTSHGAYRSIDGGDSWVETNFNPIVLGKGGLGSNFSINRIMYHPTIPNLVYVGARDGLYRSDDNLVTWTQITTSRVRDIEFHPTNPSIMYIYNDVGDNRNRILHSEDNGLTFTASALIVGNDNNTRVQIDVSPICPDCMYFSSTNGVWKSFDAGFTFEFISAPPTSAEGFAVSDLDTSRIITGYLDGFTSDDGGATFEQSSWWSLGSSAHGPGSFQDRIMGSDRYMHADYREAECINGIFYASTDGYFGKSEDGGITWTRLTDNMGIRENYSLGASQSNHYRTIVGSQDNGTSIKQKEDWVEFWGADGMEGIIHPLNDDWMFGSNQFGGRRRTYNGGLTQGGASPPGHSSGWIAPLAYDPNDHMTVYHFGVDVHKSENFGNSWTVTGSPSFDGQISEAALAENNTDIIIVSRGSSIERSTDGGVTFTNIKGTLPGFSITDIAFDPNDDNTFVVTYNRYQNDGQKVFITHDLGNTWENITANIENMPIRGAVIDHSDESYIYLAAEIGVYVKAMDATDWELYNENLPNCMIYEMEIVNGSNTLRAATWGRGVWEYTLKDRASYPAILTTDISHTPTYETPKESVNQFITSTINYDGTLTNVYVEWSVDEPIFDNTITMENVSDSTWVTETAIPDYPVGTKIYFKVFAEGESDDLSETYKFMYEIQPFEYCEATGSSGTGSDYIDFVELNSISNSSGQDFYGDYTAMSTELFIDSVYTVQVGLNFHFAPDEVGAWIDFDGDSDFEEEEFITMSAIDGDHQSFGTFTVPDNAVTDGLIRMRVRNVWDGPMVPCGSDFGEVEDYSIQLISCATLASSSIDVTTCEEYTSPSGLYTWDETGVYLDTISTLGACDSIITVNLTIGEADVSVTTSDFELEANAVGVFYQWLDCNNDWSVIDGATAQTYIPENNGSYAVVIKDGLCIDTSDCFDIVALSLDDLGEFSEVKLFPNPAKDGNVTISIGQVMPKIQLTVHDVAGKVIFRFDYENTSKIELDLSIAAGVYYINLQGTNEEEIVLKLAIE